MPVKTNMVIIKIDEARLVREHMSTTKCYKFVTFSVWVL
jgi:hypothetical protein